MIEFVFLSMSWVEHIALVASGDEATPSLLPNFFVLGAEEQTWY